MTLNRAIEAELPFLRAEAEARMTSTCRIIRRADHAPQDEDSGLEAPLWQIVYESLPCRLSDMGGRSAASRTLDLDGIELQVGVRVLNLPAATDDLADHDVAEILSGENAGTTWRLVETKWADHKTARRINVIEADLGEEWP